MAESGSIPCFRHLPYMEDKIMNLRKLLAASLFAASLSLILRIG
jgi:hypothetical protein